MDGFQRYIKAAREKLTDPTNAELARKLGVNRSTITRWEDGSRAPTPEEARALAELLGMPAGVLMCEAEAARAKEDATRAEWLSVARLCARQTKTGAELVGLIAAAVLLLWTSPEKALAAPPVTNSHVHAMHIIAIRAMRKRLARLLSVWLQQLGQPPRRAPTLRPA